jgi:hypothetical protein
VVDPFCGVGADPGPAGRPGRLDALPQLDDDQVLEALNRLGVAPDPDEVDELYFGCHRRTMQQSAILAQLQLHARRGTKVELRELARMAGIVHGDPSTACRVVHRLQRLGVLLIEGGERTRDEQGQVRRSCQSYGLRYPAGQIPKPERALLARTYTWALGAGVPEPEARSCCRQGAAGRERLARLVRLRQLQGEAQERRLRAINEERRWAEQRQPSGGAEPIAAVVAELKAELERRRPQVQHGDPNLLAASAGPRCNRSSVGISHGEIPTYSAPAHVRHLTPDEEQASFDVTVYAEKVGSRLPWLDARTVVTESRRWGVPAWQAAREYCEFAGDALELSRAGRVRRPAAWAMGAFKRRMAGEEVA